MRTIALLFVAGVTVGAQVMVSPQPPQPRDPTVGKPAVGTGVIRGRVMAADTGMPIRRAQVTLSVTAVTAGGPSARPQMMYTDAEGRYAFTSLPPATYMVSVSPGNHRAGYLSGGYGAAYFGGPVPSPSRPKPIELADGQQVGNIDVSLIRGGAIVGTVTDGSGDPASRVQVGAMIVRRGMEPSMVGSVSTDDLGQFRIFGLAPGDYAVFAEARGGGFGGPSELQGEVVGFATTYAPGTGSLSDAMRVRLPRGGQASVDIRLIETRVYTIRGIVVTSSAEPSKNVNVMVSRSETSPMMGGYGAGVMPDGTFIVRTIPPGQYSLIATYSPGRETGTSGPQSMDNTEMATVRVDVGAADVDGVVLATQRGATVTGQIVFEDGQSEGRRAQVYTQMAERRRFGPSPTAEVKDTAFTIRNLFGRVLIRGSVIGRPADLSGESWGLKAVMLNGRDITDEPRAFTNADSGKLQLLFTSQAPALDGTVTDDAGRPVQECTVLLFGEDAASWQPSSSMIRFTRPMKEGKFRVRGLREGRYRIVALPANFMLNMTTPDVQLLEALSKVATPLVLNAGETRTVDLKVTPFEM